MELVLYHQLLAMVFHLLALELVQALVLCHQ